MNFTRQLSIADPGMFRSAVTLVGAGGIGSAAALALAKMGVSELEIWDDDLVEEHNLPNQLYRISDIGSYKAEALADICSAYSTVKVSAVTRRLDAPVSGVVISGVDSMKSRRDIWNRARYVPGVSRYIDGRMGGLLGMIYTVDPNDPASVAYYESTLHSDAEAEQEPCTHRAIVFNTLMLASLIANAAKAALLGEPIEYARTIFCFKTMQLITLPRASAAVLPTHPALASQKGVQNVVSQGH